MKLVKGILIGFTALVLLLIAVMAAVVLLVDPNDYKAELEQLAAKKQVQLAIDGELSWQFYPRLGLRTGKLTVLPPVKEITTPIAFDGMNIAIKVLPLLDGELVAANVSVDGGTLTLLDAKGEQVSIANINIRGEDLNTQQRPFPFSLAFELATVNPQQRVSVNIDSQLTIDKAINLFSLLESTTTVNYSGPATGQKQWPATLALKADINLASASLTVKEWLLDLFTLSAKGHLNASSADQILKSDGDLVVEINDLNQLLQRLDQAAINTADSNALQKIVLQSQFSLAEKTLNLEELKIQLDDTVLQGKVNALLEEVPQLNVLLAGTEIDIDRYLPPVIADAEPKKEPGTKQQKDPAETDIPVESITALPGNYELGFKKVKAKHLVTEDLRLSLSISKEGLLELKTMQAKLYGGEFNLQGNLDARSPEVLLTLKPTLSPVNVELLLKDLQQTENPLANGDFAFSADLSTQGATDKALLNNLNGSLTFQSDQLQLNGIDITNSLGKELAALLKSEVPKLMQQSEQTVMTDLVGKANITNGVIDNRVMKANSLCSQFKGEGKINLVNENLRYAISVTFPSSDTNPACEEINPRLKDIAWPVQCKGAFSDEPSKLCGPNKKEMDKIFEKMLKKEAKRKIKKELDKKLKEKLGDDDDVKKLFKGLFN